MHIIMDLTTLLAVYGVVVGAGAFGIAVVRARNGNNKTVINGNGRTTSLNKVLELITGRIKEFRETNCEPIKKETDRLFETQQKMYRIELGAAAEVLHGEVTQISNTLTTGLASIDGRIERIENRIEENGKKK